MCVVKFLQNTLESIYKFRMISFSKKVKIYSLHRLFMVHQAVYITKPIAVNQNLKSNSPKHTA